MALAAEVLAGYIILGVGALLLLIAIILIIVIVCKRKSGKYSHIRSPSPDQFKVVYNVPTINGGGSTKIVDAVDARSVHTIPRSDTGYVAYVSPPHSPAPQIIQVPPPHSPRPEVIAQPMLLKAPPMLAVNPSYPTLPRAVSVDQLNYASYPTMPRAGYRYAYPSGTSSRVLVPISKKQAKRIQKEANKPVYVPVYPSGSKSVLSVPAYATSVRSGRSAASESGLRQQSKYLMYGSTPNLNAQQHTQPVMMYDGRKKYFFADEINSGRNEHVQNWLYRGGERPTSLPTDDHVAGVHRAQSHASSSIPIDVDQTSEHSRALHLRWSPRMHRRMAEKSQRTSGSLTMNLGHEESPPRSPRYVQPQSAGATVIVPAPASPTRYAPLHNYTELTEAF